MFTIKRNNFMLSIKENILVRLKVVLVCLVLSIILRGNTICISCNNWHHSKRMRLQEILSYFKLLSYIKLYETCFSHYSWRLIALDRRLKFCNIYRHDKYVKVDEVTDAIKKECEGPVQS